MDLRTGTGSRTEGLPPLRAVPAVGTDATSPLLEDAFDAKAMQQDQSLLREAATLMAARRRLDGLLLQRTANPFDPAAYRGPGSYLVGPRVHALAAYEHPSASAVRGL